MLGEWLVSTKLEAKFLDFVAVSGDFKKILLRFENLKVICWNRF